MSSKAVLLDHSIAVGATDFVQCARFWPVNVTLGVLDAETNSS